ncbi:unnamed protein product [Soboliphyme baturini]|uniref:PKHA7 n=1 Tax=Soboliphyme baturini TaxID=241478 RepID=A0A183IEG2_9BILA|nr:unnamed protein product [Soboliphyme baturini]
MATCRLSKRCSQVEREEEHYRLHVIDPKVDSLTTPNHLSQTLPAEFRRRNRTPDFPSSHSKQSFLKLDPLERPQRQKLRSVEVRPITPRDYLSESLERHRAISQSPLRDRLKVAEKSVNERWEKPARPERPVSDSMHPPLSMSDR